MPKQVRGTGWPHRTPPPPEAVTDQAGQAPADPRKLRSAWREQPPTHQARGWGCTLGPRGRGEAWLGPRARRTSQGAGHRALAGTGSRNRSPPPAQLPPRREQWPLLPERSAAPCPARTERAQDPWAVGDVRRARQLPSRMVPPPSCSTQHVRGPTGGAAGRGRVPTRHTRLDLSYCRRTSLSLLPSPGICLGCPTPPITNLRVPRPRGQPHLLLGVDNSPQEEFHPLSFAASLGSSSLGKSEEHVCGCPKLLRNSVDAGSPWTGSGLSPDPGPTGGS